MRLRGTVAAVLFGLSLMAGAAWAQQSGQVQSAPPQAGTATPVVGFAIHGVIRSGGTKLPGVSVTAAHSLTGRKVITSTDVDGSFRLELPSKGRWVLRVEFPAFAAQTAEVVLTAAQPEATHDFDLILLSRVPKTPDETGEAAGQNSGGQSPSTNPAEAGRGAQTLTLSADDAALAQPVAPGEAEAPMANGNGLAASPDATNQSVSISGRMGNAQDFGLQNMDELRDRVAELRARGELGPGGFEGGGGPGGGSFGLGGLGGGGGRLRLGSLTRPHGQIYYNASNAALDAAPYSLNGPAEKPAYGSNKIGAVLGGPLKIPHVYDDGGKTFFFLNYSGSRSSTPYDKFSHVPTLPERGGDLSDIDDNSLQLYNPLNGLPMSNNCVGNINALGTCVINPQAAALLNYIPLPNVNNGSPQNYHFSSAAKSDQDIFALRLTHNFDAPIGQSGMRGAGGGRSGRPRNNLSFGLNYQRNETGDLEPFATVGGSTHTNGFNANAGWAVTRGKLSNQFRFTWNRSRAHTGNYYGGVLDVAGMAGINYPAPANPLMGSPASPVKNPAYDPAYYGVPGLAFSHFSSLMDVAPSQSDSQTFSLSESLGWVHGKHHLHFGGDYRWIDNKAYASSNPRGTFTFTGSSTARYVNGIAQPGTGYDLADFLLGYAQSASLAYSAVHDQYRADGYDFFAQDDWRARGNLTVNYGLRYEFISPFQEARDQLEGLIPLFNAAGVYQGVSVVEPGGMYGRSLMHPQRDNFAPRIGIAWKPLGAKTVVRAGYGINYNLGQYASVVQNLATHPPCAQASSPCAVTETIAAPASAPSPITLQNGLLPPVPTATPPAITNNYGVDPNYRVAYVQMWNLNVQYEMTPTVLLNVGYTGSKGSALDMLRAPNRGPDGLLAASVGPSVEPFNWETSQGSSILHAGSVRLRKRMTKGFAVGGTYTYSKSIDNASSIGNGAQVVAQNDQNLRAERGLSSFDQRHKLTGDWTLELPWGEGRKWLTRPGLAQKAFGDWVLQSSFTVASGTPFTAHVQGSFDDVAGGVNGTLRANRVPGQAQTGSHSITEWFNTAAFTAPPAGSYGNAGRNTIIGPGSWVFNLVLSKNIPLKDSMGLEMRAEADNVLNHPNYAGIDTAVNSPTYGEVTSVASMRKMILSVHYRF